VDVALDDAFLGRAIRLLGGRGGALLAKNRDGFLDVAVGLGECLLAVEQTRAGFLAQIRDRLGRDGNSSGAN
jgi:hypothetical protein